MKKKTLFTLLTPLIIASMTGCNVEDKYELYVSTDNMRFNPQIKGEAFDPTGLEVKEVTKNGKKEREIQYTIDAPSVIDGDEWSATITAEGYEPVTINGQTRDKIKVACVGDSLTYGHVWQSEAYPVFLQQNLGNKFNVGNFGENGVSITGFGGSYDNANDRYIKRQVYKDSVKFNPDVIVMCLGTNDGTHWYKAAATYEEYYHVLVDAYLEQFPNSQWVFMVSPPCEDGNAYDINNEAMREHINPVQRAIAEEYGFELIDLRNEFEAMEGGYASMLRPTWNGRKDMVHYSKVGAQYVAGRVNEVIDTFSFRNN